MSRRGHGTFTEIQILMQIVSKETLDSRGKPQRNFEEFTGLKKYKNLKEITEIAEELREKNNCGQQN